MHRLIPAALAAALVLSAGGATAADPKTDDDKTLYALGPLMVRDLAAAEALVELTDEARDLLAGPIRPIVLLPRLPDAAIATAIRNGSALTPSVCLLPTAASIWYFPISCCSGALSWRRRSPSCSGCCGREGC